MSTKKKSDHEAYLKQMDYISNEFSETSHIKAIDRNVSKVTFEDSDRPRYWKEITGDDLKREGAILARNSTPILLTKPSENELNTPKEDPDQILLVKDDMLYYGTESEYMDSKEKEIPIPSKVWVFVEAPSKITYTESSNYEVRTGGGNPRNTSNGEPGFNPNTDGDALWFAYTDEENPIDKKIWYTELPYPAQRRYLDNRETNLNVDEYNVLDTDLEKIRYLSDLKAESQLAYERVIKALGVDLKVFNSAITEYRKRRNLDINTQTKMKIAKAFGREIPLKKVKVPKKEFDNSEENIQALGDLKEALKNEEDVSKVFVNKKTSESELEKDYKFIFPDGRVISLNVISGVQALIRDYDIKYLEKSRWS